jgi:hypothetical protein
MTGFGSLLWIIAVGALVYFMMRKGGGCCAVAMTKAMIIRQTKTGHEVVAAVN